MTTEQEAALREALEKATPGPWRECKDGGCTCGMIFGDGGNVHVASVIGPNTTDDYRGSDLLAHGEMLAANAALIVLAVNSLPDLLSSLAAERAAREKAEAERDEARSRFNDIDLCREGQAPCDSLLAAAATLRAQAEEIERLRAMLAASPLREGWW